MVGIVNIERRARNASDVASSGSKNSRRYQEIRCVSEAKRSEWRGARKFEPLEEEGERNAVQAGNRKAGSNQEKRRNIEQRMDNAVECVYERRDRRVECVEKGVIEYQESRQ